MHTARKKEKVKWRVATLNVNSIAQKAESVRKLCLDNNIDVCALQETRAFPEPDPFLDSEYSVVKMCPPQMERGTLGIAMLIKKPLLWEVLPYSTYNDLWVLVSNKTTSVIFVCVYVPCCDNLMALRVKNGILTKLNKLSKRSNQAPVVLMGDFNQPPTNVTTWFHQRKVNLLWVPHKGDAITHKGSSQSKGSTLDYILVPEKGVHYEQAIVHMGRNETLSDHFFVCASLWLKKESEPAPERPRVNREKVLEDFSAVTDDPRFHPSTCANTSVEQFTEDLLDAITEEGFLLKKRELFKRKMRVFNHREATLLAKRRTILQQRRQGGERTERDQTVLKKCRQLLRRVTHNHRFSFARQLVRTSKRKPAAFWRHIDQRIAGSPRKPLIIRDPCTGQIVTQPRQVVGVWKRHYTNVVSDASGRSKNREYWETIPLTPNPNSKLKDSEEWDSEITEYEVENVVMAMGNGKSTGDDCIPVEVYKKLLRNRNKTLTCHINQLFDGHIPESFMTSQVISLHKKGDPMDVDNYRGISLMNVILKIACAVVANRITHEVETDHLLTPAQAGFRPEMQCIAVHGTRVRPVGDDQPHPEQPDGNGSEVVPRGRARVGVLRGLQEGLRLSPSRGAALQDAHDGHRREGLRLHREALRPLRHCRQRQRLHLRAHSSGAWTSHIQFSIFINTSSSLSSSTTSYPSSLKESPGNLPAPTSSSRMTCASWGGVRRSCSDGWTR